MRVIFAGTPEAAVPSLEKIAAGSHEVAAVLTRPDAPVGRRRTLTPSPVKTRAIELGLDVIEASRVRGDVIDRIAALEPDAVPIVAYGAIIGPRALAVPKHGWVNLHFSLLPEWRGAAPVQRAIMAGRRQTGATTFALDVGVDTGDILGTLDMPIEPGTTSGDLLARMAGAGADLLLRTLNELEDGSARYTPQPETGATYAEKLATADGRLDWRASAAEIDARARAVTPAPGAWATMDGARFKLGPVSPRPDVPTLEPGAVRVVAGDVLVGTGDTPVALGDIAPPGKKTMPALDWARGLRGDSHRFDTPEDDA
ncbi:methionyl-tRNA formyltransferase [Spelaeicoccus albus]|uniref:Methionyl-tRNA formyltransferase n=1 Tax=Spelaeicoccus albus TaxID=1280376 RepID=A0A7Z0D4D9_9MICO|nr:methionyl-tRNA formyltransferase [Spelaeicoccus albus]NYI68596.1 methionyl-tRNA formyltransferase [Spelaeicoccus albus]